MRFDVLLLLPIRLAILAAGFVRHQLRLDRLAGQIEIAGVNAILDLFRCGISTIGIVDNEQPAAGMRQHHGTRIEQAVGVMHLDGFAPFVAVEPAGEGQPVRAGMTAVTAAELLAVGQPQPALAVESQTRVSVARRLLESLRRLRDCRRRALLPSRSAIPRRA